MGLFVAIAKCRLERLRWRLGVGCHRAQKRNGCGRFIALLNDPDAFIATLYGGELCVEPRRELATQTFASPADIQAASHASGA
jgi:hypothetical protein